MLILNFDIIINNNFSKIRFSFGNHICASYILRFKREAKIWLSLRQKFTKENL